MITIVMAFGTFDLLHPGHVDFLRQAKALGDRLIVVIARDRNVAKIKGALPSQDEFTRQKAVKNTGIADEVVLGDLNDFLASLRRVRPTLIAIGYDQRVDREALLKEFPTLRIVRLQAFEPKKYKSSLLKKR